MAAQLPSIAQWLAAPRSRQWRWWELSGIGVLVGVGMANELLAQTPWLISHPSTLLVGAVVYAALVGGMRLGLVSALLAISYSAYFLLARGTDAHYSPMSLLSLLVVAPLTAVAVGMLRQELSSTLLSRERWQRKHAAARAQEQALQAANRQMDALLSNVCHELRTPLTSIKMSVQISRHHLARWQTTGEGELADRSRVIDDVLGTADRQITVLSRLVDDLMDESRLHAGKLTMQMAPVDLVGLVQDAVAAQCLAWPLRTITVAATASLLVQADATRIRQVVANYLTNALKFAPPNAPITVDVAAKGKNVQVSVHDEGPGLTAAQQQRIWERLYQVEGMPKVAGAAPGLGLGLHLCQAIITSHNGTVGVTSQPGQGATFWFSLPLLPPVASTAATPTKS